MGVAVSRGTPQDNIGLVSFTRAAAHELAKRAGVKPGHNISTLHSYAFRLSGMVRDQVIDRAKLKAFSKASKIETTGANVYDSESIGPGDYYLGMYGYMRSRLMADTKRAFYEAGRHGSLTEFDYFVRTYDEWKRLHGYADFHDMLTLAMDAEPPKIDIIFLDEAQDFTTAQWTLIQQWIPHLQEVVIAGDDDQTLYSWNGADPAGMFGFEKAYGADRVVLDKSYRVPANIHTLANRLIHNVSDRVDKLYLPVDDGGEIRRCGTLQSVVPPDPSEDTLVLFRNHSLRDEIEEWLIDRCVPYITDGGRRGPLQGPLAAAIDVWGKLQENVEYTGQPMLPDKQFGLLRKMAMPVYQGKMDEVRVVDIAGKHWHQVLRVPMKFARYYRRLEEAHGTPLPVTKVHLSTIHGSKGREASRVVLLNGMSYNTAEAATKDIDPEIRAFYVAVTRAKHKLDIVTGDNSLKLL